MILWEENKIWNDIDKSLIKEDVTEKLYLYVENFNYLMSYVYKNTLHNQKIIKFITCMLKTCKIY